MEKAYRRKQCSITCFRRFSPTCNRPSVFSPFPLFFHLLCVFRIHPAMKNKDILLAYFACFCLGAVMFTVPLAFPKHKKDTNCDEVRDANCACEIGTQQPENVVGKNRPKCSFL
jgi:hypothetical protein